MTRWTDTRPWHTATPPARPHSIGQHTDRPATGTVTPTRYSTPDLDSLLLALADTAAAAGPYRPDMADPADCTELLSGIGQSVSALADCQHTADPGTVLHRWPTPTTPPAPPTDTAGRQHPASAPRRERDNSMAAMLARAGRPARTTDTADNPDPTRYPLDPDTAAAVVADWHGATPTELLSVLSVLDSDPLAQVATSDGRPVLAREMVDPIRHLLARAVRSAVGYTDPTPRTPRRYDRMARRNGSARRSSVAVIG